MIFRSPIWLWLLPLVLVASGLIAWRRALPWFVVALRTLLVALLVFALADPVRPGTAAGAPLVVLADQSASLGEQAQTTWATAQEIADARGDEQTVLAGFGRTVVVSTDGAAPSVERDATDLAGALRFAATQQPDGGRAVLLGDGAGTTSGIDEALAELQRRGIAVDVLPVATDDVRDARVAEIGLPRGLRAGQQFGAEARISSTFDTAATLIVSLDGAPLAEQSVTLEVGQTVVPLQIRAPAEGLHRLRAELRLGDQHTENNALETTLSIGSTPKVLVVEREPDSAARLRDQLEAEGIQSEALRPADLRSTLSDLERFDAIVLQDVPATALRLDQQAALREYVHTLGHGLLTLGGANSYSLGGYADTPLADVLPVAMDTPPNRERQQVAILLIVDRSASMFAANPQDSKLELAKGGAIAVTQVLASDDQVGVLTFDTKPAWSVPFQRVGEGLTLSQIQDQIRAIDYGGGTDVYNALGTGLVELAQQNAPVRHALLLTDGRSPGNSDKYQALAESARANNITLSTFALGGDADTALLERLADWGGGRYQFVSDPAELPQITLNETEIARENPRIEGTFQPQPDGAHPITRGLVPNQLPTLDGYVGLTTKPEAENVLVSADGDPILASWQYGLGRAAAWTSDSGEQWGEQWRDWQRGAVFWSQALGYVFPDPAQGPLTARVELRNDTPTLVADARSDDGNPLDLADIGARVEQPDGTQTTLRLQQVEPGRYEAALPTAAEGAYTIALALRKGEQQLEANTGWTQAYAPEWTQAPNRDLLERIATTTGGRVISGAGDIAGALAGEGARPTYAWWPWLIGAAVVLWPLELGLRRWRGGWR